MFVADGAKGVPNVHCPRVSTGGLPVPVCSGVDGWKPECDGLHTVCSAEVGMATGYQSEDPC